MNQTVLGRLFGYGSISVQTAAMGETVVDFVETPQLLKETINAQKANANKVEHAEQAAQHRPGTVARTVLIQENTKLEMII